MPESSVHSQREESAGQKAGPGRRRRQPDAGPSSEGPALSPSEQPSAHRTGRMRLDAEVEESYVGFTHGVPRRFGGSM